MCQQCVVGEEEAPPSIVMMMMMAFIALNGLKNTTTRKTVTRPLFGGNDFLPFINIKESRYLLLK